MSVKSEINNAPFAIKRRRSARPTVILPLLLVLAFGCAPAATPAAPATPAPPTVHAEAAQGLEVLLASSRHVVGPSRFPVGVIRDGHSVKEAQVKLRFFEIRGDEAVLKGETDAPFYGDNLGEAGVYVARTTFDKPGTWGVEAVVTEPGRVPEAKRIAFEVLPDDPSPAIGEDAPRSQNPTLKEVNGDRTKICSATEDDSILHQISISEALTNGKPTVILFATPRFCTTRTCGPSHQVVLGLARNYADRVNFIHVEVYKEFQRFTRADAMNEWRLDTEPWLFFVDRNGKIVDKYEGGITAKEIVPAFLEFIGE